MATEKITYKYIADTTQFDKNVKGASSSTEKLSSAAKKGALGVAAVGVAMTKSAFLASDYNESLNVITQVFGENTDAMIKWSDTSIQAMGISATQALKTAGTYGSMGKSLGLTDGQTLKYSQSLTQLSADMASYYNVSQEVAANALKGIFTGETEALKGFGLILSETTLEQYGYNKNMTEAEKIQIRYKAVMEQTATVQGDFARTSDGLANATRVMQEQFIQLATDIGQKLIPAFEAIVGLINDGLAVAIAVVNGEMPALNLNFQLFAQILPILSVALVAVGLVFLAFTITIGEATLASVIFAGVQTLITVALGVLSGMVTLVTVGFGLFTAVIDIANLAIVLFGNGALLSSIKMGLASAAAVVWGAVTTALTTIMTIATAVMDFLSLAVIFVGNNMSLTAIKTALLTTASTILSGALTVLTGIFTLLTSPVILTYVAIGVLVATVSALIVEVIKVGNEMGVWEAVLRTVKITIMVVIDALVQIISTIVQTIAKFIQMITTNERFVAGAKKVALAIGSLVSSLMRLIQWVAQTIAKLITFILTNENTQNILKIVSQAIGLVVQILGKLVSWVAQAIAKFVQWITTSETVKTVLNALKSVINFVLTVLNLLISAAAKIIGKFIEWASKSEFVKSALDGVKTIINGISDAIGWLIGKISEVIGWFGSLADKATDALKSIPFIGGLFGGQSANLNLGVDDQTRRLLNGNISANSQDAGNVNNTKNVTYNVHAQKVMSMMDAHREKVIFDQQGGNLI